MNESKLVGVRIPLWMYRDMIKSSGTNKTSERIKELITKGFMYEQQMISSTNHDNRRDKDALSVIQSRDYKGFAGFPEMAV